MEKYLITGCAGFIGSHLAESILKKGNEIVSIDNLDSFYSSAEKEKNLSEIKKVAADNNIPFYDCPIISHIA